MCERRRQESEKDSIILENGPSVGEVLHSRVQSSKKAARVDQSH